MIICTGRKQISELLKRSMNLSKIPAERHLKVRGSQKPLKHNLSGFWSRRITEEHRLVYAVTDDSLLIAACRYHY